MPGATPTSAAMSTPAGKPLADRGKVARAAAVERQAREGARKIGSGAERGADLLAAAGVGQHPGDRVEAPVDQRHVGRRAGDAGGPGAARRRR